MKLTVNRQNLHHIVNVVTVVVPTRTTYAALTGIVLRFKDGTLTAGASDIASFAVAHCKAEGDEMAFGVPAGLLSHFLSTCQADEVVIELDTRATFTCGLKRATLTVINEKEFGTPNEIVGVPIMIGAQMLHDSLSRIMHCAAEEGSGLDRPVLASVLFDFTKGGLTLFTTDGKQIAFTKHDITGKGAYPVPRKLVGHIMKLIAGAAEGVGVAVTFAENAMSVESDFWTLTGSLLQGQFPDWPNAIPKSTDPIVAKRDDLANALKSCMPFGEAGFTRVVINAEENLLRFNSGAGNECQDEVVAQCKPFKLAIEAKRLLNLVNSLSGETVTLEINNNPSTPPCVMMREENFTGVLMPLRS